MSAIVYQNGTVISNPDQTVYRPVPPRDIAKRERAFTLSFKHTMKLRDAAHIQHLELSQQPRLIDRETGALLNAGINHVFLTPTFDENSPATFKDDNNDAIKRFTDNLSKRYGMTSYVWVKEFTKHLVPHYHMLATLPRTDIADLNRAWSHARGDVTTVKNALRTGWDKKAKRSYMVVRSYRNAVGYITKYMSKARTGNICALNMKCDLKGPRFTWDGVEGHSSKCYGMSQNLHREPRQLDLFMQFHLHPWLARSYRGYFMKEDPTGSRKCDLYFFDDPSHANLLYSQGTPKQEIKKLKFEAVRRKHSPFDQLRFPL